MLGKLTTMEGTTVFIYINSTDQKKKVVKTA